jgi:uncharacterized protein YeaO (DUF488 family)
MNLKNVLMEAENRFSLRLDLVVKNETQRHEFFKFKLFKLPLTDAVKNEILQKIDGIPSNAKIEKASITVLKNGLTASKMEYNNLADFRKRIDEAKNGTELPPQKEEAKLEDSLKNRSNFKIYTSYFANPKLKSFDGVKVSIARTQPGNLKYPSISELAPSVSLLKYYKSTTDPKEVKEAKYREEYKNQLRGLNRKEVMKKIFDLSKGKDVALLCWEVPTDFCHRKMAGKWLENATADEMENYLKEPLRDGISELGNRG